MQQVNLYQSQFKPKLIILPAQQLLLIASLPIIIFIIVSLYLSHKQQLSTDLLQQQQHQVQLEQQRLTSVKQQLESRKQNPLLVTELKDLQQQLKNKQVLLDHLSNQKLGNQIGFSSTLTALSKQHIEELWLTQFSLLNSGQFIALQGTALTSQLIPEYIDKLAESTQFQGKNFSVFQLKKHKDSPYFNFKLHTSEDMAAH